MRQRWVTQAPVTFHRWTPTQLVRVKFFTLAELKSVTRFTLRNETIPRKLSLKWLSCWNSSDPEPMDSWEMTGKTHNASCVVMNVQQASYSYWMRLHCSVPIVNTVMCQDKEWDQACNTQWEIDRNILCSKGQILSNTMCILLQTSNSVSLAAQTNIQQNDSSWTKEIKFYINVIFLSDDDFVLPVADTPSRGIILHKNSFSAGDVIGTTFNLFQCEEGQFINTLFIGDGVGNCDAADLSDEQYPSKEHNNKSASQSFSNDCKPNFYRDKFGQCRSYIEISEVSLQNQVLRNSTMYQQKQTDVSVSFACFNDEKEEYFFFEHCFYNIHKNGSLLFCSNGMHLRNCSLFECMGTWKCPKAHCIPFLLLCDGKWDCSAGADEMNCTLFTCSHMFKCNKKKQCIHLLDVCDGLVHCHQGDDEALCNLVKCHPISCLCLNNAISCSRSTKVEEYFQALDHIPFIYVSLFNCLDFFPTFLFSISSRKVVLEVPNNRIHDVCGLNVLGQQFDRIVMLNMAQNFISVLKKNCFNFAMNLMMLSLKDNKIQAIEQKAFCMLHHLVVLDLSLNQIININAFAFQGLTNLKQINILQKLHFDFIHASAFTDSNHSCDQPVPHMLCGHTAM